MSTEHDRLSESSGQASAGGTLVEYETFIENHLRRTRSHVRSVDLAGGVMTLAAGSLLYFFLAAIVDHWAVTGGLGFWGRLLFLLVYLAGATYYLVAEVLPLLIRRINPVYAAYTIERSRPSLKNALVNFLLFRADPAGLSPAVYEAVEEQAATNLAKVRVEAAVDRTRLIHIGYALVGVLIVCAAYTLLSPKNLLQSIGRVAMPWADIGVPTRTAIVEIEPGDAEAFRGQQVTVKARVEGLRGDGKVRLVYSTADGQIVNRAMEMNLASDGYKHECVLPSADAALQQSLTYRIESGDAATRPYRVTVVAAPTIVVRAIDYKYPTYTGLVAQRVERQGDIKAIEGTEVTIEAIANQDIQSATIDFDCDNKHDLRMQVDGQQARATFRLALTSDRHTPEHRSYQLILKDQQGRQNPQPIRHEIEVTRDVAPELQFVAPRQDDLDLPANRSENLELVAQDPDFALRLVKLSATSRGKPVVDKMLLNEPRQGQFVQKYPFEPRKLGLKEGDVVEYWATAEDTKDPGANRTETPKRRIRVVSPSAQPPNNDRIARNQPRGGQRQDGADGEAAPQGDHPRTNDDAPTEKPKNDAPASEKSDRADEAPPAQDPQQPEPNNSKDGQGNEGQSSGGGNEQPGKSADPSGSKPSDRQDKNSSNNGQSDSAVPNDGSDDGDAFERILKHRDEQDKSGKKSSGASERPTDKSKPDRQQGDDQNSGAEEADDKSKSEAPQNDQPRDRKSSPDKNRKPNDRSGENSPQKEPGGQNDPGAKPNDATDQPEAAQNSQDDDNPQREPMEPNNSGGGKQSSQAKSEKRKPESQPRDPSQGEQGEQGSGSGAGGQGNEGAGGQDGQAGSKGQSGQARPSNQGKRGKGSSQSSGGADDAGEGGTADKKGTNDNSPSHEDKGKEGAADKGAKQDKRGDRGKADRQTKGKADSQPGDAADSSDAADDRADGDPPGAGEAEKPSDGKADRGSKDGKRQSSDRQAERGKSGQGAAAKDDPTRKRSAKNQPPTDKQDKPDARGGDGDKEKGQSGAGQQGEDTKGSPSPTEGNQPREKTPSDTPDDKDDKKDDDSQSPSNSHRESDSQGADDGDRSGGGKRGGGQKANKSGTGGAGQNTASDEGAGRSDESGKGEDSGRAGTDRQANDKTGKSGQDAGKGSSSRAASGKGGKPDGNDEPQPGERPSQSNQSSGSGGKPGGPPSEGVTEPRGGRPSNAQDDEQRHATPDHADEANLDYARKATDMALEHLKDQLRNDKPDAELLDRLGWTKTDLANFVRRWEQMRHDAQAPGGQGTAAQRQLDETLRSLGLRPRATTIKSNTARDDQSRGYKESRRSSPPPEYLEQYKAYTQGTARGAK